MATSLERRTFLKTTALAAAASAAAARGWTPAQAAPAGVDPAVAARNPAGVQWNKAPCRFCGTGCHVQVGVENGRVVAIAGDQLAEVNKGLLCVKGYHVGLSLYGKDRLTQPLLRKNGVQVPVSWEEAIDVIARRIQKNPKGFAFYGSGQWTIPEGYAALKFTKGGLGSNHIDPNARLCMASAVTGFLSTYGVDEPAGCYDDLDKADVVMLWGNNPAEMHPVLFSRLIDRRTRGEKITLVDLTTRRTRSSDHAQHVLLFKPQTDLAVANGVMRELLKRGTWYKAFVDKHVAFRQDTADKPTLDGRAMDFAAFRAALEPYTPEHVEQLSGVNAADIRMLADLFGNPKLRIVSLWCMGMNQHTRGTAINRLVHALHLLSGHFGTPGNAPTSLTGQPSACGTVREVGTLAHALPGGRVVANDKHRAETEAIWNVPAGRIPAKPGYHTVQLWEKFSTPADKGGDIDTVWVQVTNPGQTLPNLGKLFQHRKAGGKFLIVSDVYPTATTREADLVLPSALWVEKNGMFGNSERRTQQWFKMVDPPGQARDDCWQTIAVAKRLFDLGFAGMRDKDGRFLFRVTDAKGAEVPAWKWERYYDVNVDKALFEEYRKFTPYKHKHLAPYDEYVKARGLRWPVVQQKNGTWRETRWRFSRFDDPFVSPDREVQFYHSLTKDDRAQVWFHPYEPPPESPDAQFPLWLCTGRVIEHWHSGTLTMRIPQLRRAMPQAYVEVNREDAARLGIGQGEVVVLETRRGRLELPAWIDGRGRPPQGSVFVPFFDEKVAINQLTLDAHDPISKQPDYKKCAVRLTKKAGGAA
jgi:nitrate reductase NapA